MNYLDARAAIKEGKLYVLCIKEPYVGSAACYASVTPGNVYEVESVTSSGLKLTDYLTPGYFAYERFEVHVPRVGERISNVPEIFD